MFKWENYFRIHFRQSRKKIISNFELSPDYWEIFFHHFDAQLWKHFIFTGCTESDHFFRFCLHVHQWMCASLVMIVVCFTKKISSRKSWLACASRFIIGTIDATSSKEMLCGGIFIEGWRMSTWLWELMTRDVSEKVYLIPSFCSQDFKKENKFLKEECFAPKPSCSKGCYKFCVVKT